MYWGSKTPEAACLMLVQRYDILWHFMTFHDILWHFKTFYDVLWHFMIFYDIIWHYMTIYDICSHLLTIQSKSQVQPLVGLALRLNCDKMWSNVIDFHKMSKIVESQHHSSQHHITLNLIYYHGDGMLLIVNKYCQSVGNVIKCYVMIWHHHAYVIIWHHITFHHIILHFQH